MSELLRYETHDYTKDAVRGPVKVCPKCGRPGFNKGSPKGYYIHKTRTPVYEKGYANLLVTEVVDSCLT